jgi:hypothetical protein
MLPKLLATAVVIAMVVGGAYAAPQEEIDQAIEDGVGWLVDAQNLDDGGWGDWDRTAHTCFALVKLQELAYDRGHESPFDPAYEYALNVILGWEYIFGVTDGAKTAAVVIGDQWHDGSPDDPDSNGNEIGIWFDGPETYSTGICTMALAASGTPDRVNDGGLDHDGDGNVDTFLEIAQDAVDWLAFAQVDGGTHEGGWSYEARDNSEDWADQSNSGYAVLGLAYGEDFGCTVPDWVRTELDIWIDSVQCLDGGSGYEPCDGYESNELRTGNLIFQMCFVGDDPDGSARFEDALTYIEDTWKEENTEPGWGYNVDPASYQAMYCLMKGFEYCGIELIDTDGDGDRDDDWFNQEPPADPPEDFATVLVEQQQDGHWDECIWGDDVLCTVWALLTLEKVAPPPPVIHVPVDIKPGSCPNPFNGKSKGVVPVAVLGTKDFDVTTIDPGTIQLTREAYDVGVPPLRWALEDVGTPFEGELCDCHDLNGDGWLDLTLKFKTQEVKETLGMGGEVGNTIPLLVIGHLTEDAGGTPFEGADCMRVLK